MSKLNMYYNQEDGWGCMSIQIRSLGKAPEDDIFAEK